EFDGIISDGLDPGAQVWSGQPDVAIIFPSLDDLKYWPKLFASEPEIDDWVVQHGQIYRKIWTRIADQFPGCKIYQFAFEAAQPRQLGNLELRYPHARTNLVRRLNEYLLSVSRSNLTFVDTNYLLQL